MKAKLKYIADKVADIEQKINIGEIVLGEGRDKIDDIIKNCSEEEIYQIDEYLIKNFLNP